MQAGIAAAAFFWIINDPAVRQGECLFGAYAYTCSAACAHMNGLRVMAVLAVLVAALEEN